jgi:hypothetical protein
MARGAFHAAVREAESRLQELGDSGGPRSNSKTCARIRLFQDLRNSWSGAASKPA